jgi:hypothetical protein
MKRTILRLSLTVALLAVPGLVYISGTVNPAASGTTRIPYEAYNIACGIQEGKVWDSGGGILHIRGRVLESVVVSDCEYNRGSGQIVANANIDLATGYYGSYFGTLAIYPDDKDGWWAGEWSMQITPGRVGGIARLQGYGPELDGLTSKADLIFLGPEQLADFACHCGGNPPLAGVYVVGFVMNAGGK